MYDVSPKNIYYRQKTNLRQDSHGHSLLWFRGILQGSPITLQ